MSTPMTIPSWLFTRPPPAALGFILQVIKIADKRHDDVTVLGSSAGYVTMAAWRQRRARRRAEPAPRWWSSSPGYPTHSDVRMRVGSAPLWSRSLVSHPQCGERASSVSARTTTATRVATRATRRWLDFRRVG